MTRGEEKALEGIWGGGGKIWIWGDKWGGGRRIYGELGTGVGKEGKGSRGWDENGEEVRSRTSLQDFQIMYLYMYSTVGSVRGDGERVQTMFDGSAIVQQSIR